MEEVNSIMETLLKIPVYELTTGMYMQIQELKELASKEENVELFMEKYKGMSFEKKNNKQDNLTISTLYKKIQTLEKINSELQSKMSTVSFDNIYLEGDNIKPTFGNILVYNEKQDYFYVIPFALIDLPIVTTFTTSSQIAGYYYSQKGWQSLLLNDNKLHISVKVDENKKLQNNNNFSILETNLWKVLIQKNNKIIPIFSKLTDYHTYIGDFNNIHRLNVFVSESKTFYTEKLQHIVVNLLQWNFTFNDFIILNDLIQGKFCILEQLKKNELFQPLFTASVIINAHEEDFVNWAILVSLLKTYFDKTEIKLPKLSLFTKTTKIKLLNYYSSILKENNEFNKIINENTIFEEQYQIFNNLIENNITLNEIKSILNMFQKREQPRKIDCWIEIIRFLFTDNFTYMKYYINLQTGKLLETENLFKSITETINKIKIKGSVTEPLITLPLSSNGSNFDVWKNVVIKNLIPMYSRKIEMIFDYLIRGNMKGLHNFFKNQKIIDIIDSIVINLYDKTDFGTLVNQINNLLMYLNIPTQTPFFEQLTDILENKEINNKILNEFLCQFTTNNHVKEVIMSINFNELCGYGIHNILTQNKILDSLPLIINSNGVFMTETGMKVNIINNKFEIIKLISSKVEILSTGLVCGYVSFNCNGIIFNSTSNIYICPTNDLSKVPSEFHYVYVINKRAIYFDNSVYNRLLENSKKYIKMLSLTNLDSYTKKYKIDINCFNPGEEIVIEDDLVLHCIDGLPFKFSNNMDLAYIINLQNEMYHSK
jgi:hypothetical protein